ncbi:MAG: crossover junction endodeoxyribonuclease RuvC [Planctomycetes bacterium]|nr:crossover junction endodeoxyribonuclease RuvC [Planctomycetota bacterium]
MPTLPAETTRVLGIDPGSRVTGWGVVERREGQLRLIAHGTLRLGDGPVPARLAQIHRGVNSLLSEHEPSAFAIEEAFLGRNVRSMMRLAEARAVAILAAEFATCPIHEVAPALVKKSVTGHGRAGKDVVREAVMRLLDWEPDATPPAYDASDALAISLCVLLRLAAPTALRLPATGIGRASRGRKRWTAADLAKHQAWVSNPEEGS